MGTKLPSPYALRCQGEQPEADAFGSRDGAVRSRADLLLRRIAGTLGVSEAALRDLPNAVPGKPGSDQRDAHTGTLDRDCMEMIRTFSRIHDPEERRRLLVLVSEIAERG